MKAFILLADAARAHGDGTFSLLRGGIDRVWALRTDPITFQGSIVVRFRASLSESGSHEFKVRVMNEDGESIAQDITGSFNIPEGGGTGQIIGDCSFILPRYGRYT